MTEDTYGYRLLAEYVANVNVNVNTGTQGQVTHGCDW